MTFSMTVTIKSIFHSAIRAAEHVFQIEFYELSQKAWVYALPHVFYFQITSGYNLQSLHFYLLPITTLNNDIFYAILFPTLNHVMN